VRRALLVVQVALASFTTAAAAAPGRTARLTYSRGAGAADCPDVEVIRAGVAARLGYEPFDDRGESDCLELASATELALSIAIDPSPAPARDRIRPLHRPIGRVLLPVDPWDQRNLANDAFNGNSPIFTMAPGTRVAVPRAPTAPI
jgi:hypothetical protein